MVLLPGRVLLASTTPVDLLRGLQVNRSGIKRVVTGLVGQPLDAQTYLKDRLDESAPRTVVDRAYSQEQMAAAHRYADSGQKQGHVVIKPGS